MTSRKRHRYQPLNPDQTQRLRQAADRLNAAGTLKAEIATELQHVMLDLINDGASIRAIADVMGYSPQRVSQLTAVGAAQ